MLMPRLLVAVLFLTLASPIAAQPYVVTHVRGDVQREGQPLGAGDQIQATDQLRFGDRNALAVIASPSGQAVLRAQASGGSRAGEAALLYVRDLVMPLRDRTHASTRALGPATSFDSFDKLRQGLGDDRWLLLSDQRLPLDFPEADTGQYALRYSGPDGVEERRLTYEDGDLVLSRTALGPACTDPAAVRPPYAWIVFLPDGRPEMQVTAYLRFACPENDRVRHEVGALTEATGESGPGRLLTIEAFLDEAYGATFRPALNAWLAAAE